MSPIKGLRLLIAAAIIQLQACNAAVIRNMETTTLKTELDSPTPSQVSSLSDSTVPQDLLGQTTLPPVPFRSSTDPDASSDPDTTAGTDTTADTRPEVSTQYQAVPNVQPELPSNVLPRSELQLGGESTLADTSAMDNNPALVSTTELVSVSTGVPKVGKSTVDTMVTTKKESEHEVVLSPKLPSKAQPANVENVSAHTKVRVETLPIPKLVPWESRSSPSKVVEPARSNADTFISTTVQIMAYVVEALWEKEMNHVKEESRKVVENVNDTPPEEREEDDSSKPVFQFNVPIVNEESVPMRVHMDIIPQGFPEDLEGQTLYPDYLENKSDLPISEELNGISEKNSENPLGKDTVYDQDSAGKDENRFLKIRQQMRQNHNSDTFEKLVDLHKNLAAYVGNHEIKMFKEISDRETDVLLRNTQDAAEQLRNIIPIIFEEIDNKPLKDSLKTFLGSVSERNSESFIVLSSLPPLRYS